MSRSLARLVAYSAQPATTALTTMIDLSECEPCAEAAAIKAAGPQVAPVVPSPGVAPRWKGVIGVEGELTGDGRLIEKNALRWENLPIPFRFVSVDVGFHDGAVVVGNVDKIYREGGKVMGEGNLDLGSEEGVEAHRLIEGHIQDGVSMDLDDVSFEIRVAAELLNEDPMLAMMLGDPEDTEAEKPKPDKDGRVTVVEVQSDDEVQVTTSGRIRAVTLVAIPAFASARISLADTPVAPADGPAADCSCVEGDPNYDPNCVCEDQTGEPGLAAAAVPVSPPAAWFNRPTFDGPTALKVTPEGRVYGHIAAWETCHISHTTNGCVTPPHSNTGYAYFLTGAILTQEGAEIPVGHLTMNTRHAGDRLSLAATLAHYEDTGTVAADVTVWEDEWGIAFAGAMRPNLTDKQIREFRAAPLSGDWRRAHGNLELVAALAVNVPGFPIPRPAGRVSDGQVKALVASGMLPPGFVSLVVKNGLSDDDMKYLKRLADRERQAESLKAAAEIVPDAADMARRVRASQLAMRVHRGKD